MILKKNVLRIVLFSLVFLAIYFLARLPFYDERLKYEEGIFAYLVTNQPESPNYGLLGRINGQDKLGPLEHPAFLYETIKLAGLGVNKVINWEKLSEEQRSYALRIAFSLMSFMVWIVLFIFIQIPRKKLQSPLAENTPPINVKNAKTREKYLLVMLAALITLPIATKTSAELQVDGSSGMLMNGMLALSVYYTALFTKNNKVIYSLILLGSLAVGLGKNEWSLALLATNVLLILYLLVVKFYFTEKIKKGIYLSISSIGGLLLGNSISYLFDPLNYLGGWNVLTRVSKAGAGLDNIAGRWWEIFWLRFPYILPLFIILLVALVFIVKWTRKKHFIPPGLILLFLYGSVLFVSFLSSLWSGEERYFAPAFIVLATLLLSLVHYPIIRSRKLIIALISLFLLNSIYFAYNNQFFYLESTKPIDIKSKDCVQMLETGIGYSLKGVDFVGNGMSLGEAKKIAGENNKVLCEP
jgi:hypothetical protein